MTTHVDVAAYAIGSLDRDETDGFEGHLDTCPTCPAELEWLSQVVRLMTGSAFADTMLPEAS
jgi:anti-sigma factor RsiW